MNCKKWIYATALCLWCATMTMAQTVTGERAIDKEKVTVSTTRAVQLGKTKPVRDLIAKKATSKEKKAQSKRNKKRPDNFMGRGTSLVTRPELEHQGPDPLRQLGFNSLTRKPPVDVLVNVDGLVNGGTPHDPTGDIGQDYYVQSVNATIVRVFDKAGNTVETFNMNTLWSELGASSEGDPIILYDEETKQWILTEFTDPANLLIAVSETSDPLGSYYAYSFSTPNFPDYPKYGIWSNELVVTTNERGTGTLHQYFFERDSLMAGAETVRMQRVAVSGNGTEGGFLVNTPVDWNGELRPNDDRPIAVRLNDSSWGQVQEDQITMYHFDIDFDEPNNTLVSLTDIVTSAFDSNPCSAFGGQFPCVPQMTGSGLDALPELIVHVPHYRNFGTHESIVLNFVTDVTDGENFAGIRWVELRRTGDADWVLHQEGTFAPDDGLERFMGGIAMDKFGNIGMAYNVSSETSFAGIRFTGRFASDPLGEMTLDEQVIIEGTGSTGNNGRFGDYPQMSVDPIDQSTFWYTSEYGSSNGARTRVAAFQLTKDTFDLSLFRILQPTDEAGLNPVQPVEVTVFNAGLNPISNYEVGFSFQGQSIEQITMPDALMPDSTINVTFTNTIALEDFGNSVISAYVVSNEDANSRNDTLRKVINIKGDRDARLINVLDNLISCSDPFLYQISYQNDGLENLTSVMIEIALDGIPLDTISPPFLVTPGSTRAFTYNLTGIGDGDHIIRTSILSVNGGQTDQVIDGNVAMANISVGDPMALQVELMTDEYPQEIAWTITDVVSGEELASSEEYTQEEEIRIDDVCLIRGNCYLFEITDAYSDGICCFNGEGFYNLLNSNGDTIFASSGQYGAGESFEFCVDSTAGCNVSADIEFSNPSDMNTDDGTIMITGVNSTGAYLYSIDSGVTFQATGIFDNLMAGTYNIVVQVDGMPDCFYEETITLSATTSTFNQRDNNVNITVFPNPNNGLFQIEIAGVESQDYQMNIELYNMEGQLIQSRKIGKYDNVFVGEFSLVDYPNGSYLIRVVNKDIAKMAKVVKQD